MNKKVTKSKIKQIENVINNIKLLQKIIKKDGKIIKKR